MSAMVRPAREIEGSASDVIGCGVVSQSNGFFPPRSAENNAVFSLSRHGSSKSDRLRVRRQVSITPAVALGLFLLQPFSLVLRSASQDTLLRDQVHHFDDPVHDLQDKHVHGPATMWEMFP